MPLVAQPVGIWTEESTILVIWVSLLGKEWFFPFKEIIFGLTFATRQLVAQPVGLTKARSTEASLMEADLSEARLQETNLGNANLRNASLRGAHLRGANFQEAILLGTQFADADITGS